MNNLLDVLTRESVLINVSVRYWRGCKKLRPEDLGLTAEAVSDRLIIVAIGLFIAVLGYVFLVITAVFGIAAAFEAKHAWIVVMGGAALLHLAGAVALVALARRQVKVGAFSGTLEELKNDQQWLTKLASKP